MARIVLLLFSLSSLSVSIRHRRGSQETKKTQGIVDALYTYGAPGSASPGLSKLGASKGCFLGERAWAGRGALFNLTGTADAVPQITHLLGYRHPVMDSAEYDVRKGFTVRKTLCGSRYAQEAPNPPYEFRLIDPILHARSWYVNGAHAIDDAFGNFTDVATIGSYFDDEDYVKARFDALGWKFVAMAKHPGNPLKGGPQQVHLVQKPETLDCLVTFQGSDSFQDWGANFDVGKSHFCGLVDEDEECNSLIDVLGTCKVKRSGNSFVHKGFRDHMRTMVQSDEFQNNIRPLLSGCNKLNVAGHSLGGATSELFTACMARAPQPGQYGHEEDYKYMSFTKGAPRRMW